MERALVVIVAAMFVVGAVAGPAQSMNGCPPPSPCAPPSCKTLITKMVPCTRTEIVAELQPTTRCVPVKKIGWRCQKVLLKGTPVGMPCGMDPCTKCCPQPFCQQVTQQVPYEYWEYKTIPWYNIVYKPICRPVMLPQQYMVEAIPQCK